ncbi:MAG: peptidoglycan D,D-transpeptidase FtsI family protein [Anaerolineae bacterium]
MTLAESLSRGIRRLALATLLGFAVIAASTFYWGFIRSEELSARPDNQRRTAFERRTHRGRILDRAGRVLAETETTVGESGEIVPRRVYPEPSAAPVTGFQTWRYGAGTLDDATYGAGGAEAAYDVALRGDIGQSPQQILASRVLHRPQQGRDVVLTLDRELQAYAADQLGDREGAIVVLDVNSGAVRALVSQPTFDPAALDAGDMPDEDPRQPMFNRATQGLYPPGSTLKTVTLAAALDEGLVRPGDVVEDGQLVEYFAGFPVACDNNPPGKDTFTISEAFGWSCNVTFARLATELGKRKFLEYGERFGLTSAPPFPLPVAAASLTADDEMSEPELASAGFGQGEVLVTPLHMALVTAAVAGGGAVPSPYLLEDVPNVRWSGLADERGTWKRAVPGDIARAMREIMIQSAQDGWASAARQGLDLRLGGKTGTAEVAGQTPHAWYIGFAPADDPSVAIAVLVPNGGQGGDVAAPIAGRVLNRALELEQQYEAVD